jgi:hypothetical protein
MPNATTPIPRARKITVNTTPYARIRKPLARYVLKSRHPVRLVLVRLMASETPTRNRKRPAVASAKSSQGPVVDWMS